MRRGGVQRIELLLPQVEQRRRLPRTAAEKRAFVGTRLKRGLANVDQRRNRIEERGKGHAETERVALVEALTITDTLAGDHQADADADVDADLRAKLDVLE